MFAGFIILALSILPFTIMTWVEENKLWVYPAWIYPFIWLLSLSIIINLLTQPFTFFIIIKVITLGLLLILPKFFTKK